MTGLGRDRLRHKLATRNIFSGVDGTDLRAVRLHFYPLSLTIQTHILPLTIGENTMKKKLFVVSFLILTSSVSFAAPQIYEKKYHGFTVWLDCQRHGAFAFFYELDQDKECISIRKCRGAYDWCQSDGHDISN